MNHDLQISVDLTRRRVLVTWVDGIPLGDLGWLTELGHRIVGPDATIATGVPIPGGRGMAICRPEDAAAWAAETTHVDGRPPYVLLPPTWVDPDGYGLDDPANPMPEPFRWLAAAICDISEAHDHAGWATGVEWVLLEALERGERKWGISHEHLANLASIRNACDGGWVCWSEEQDCVVALKTYADIEAARKTP